MRVSGRSGRGLGRILAALLAATLCLCAFSAARANLRDDIDYITAWTLSPEWRAPEERTRAWTVATTDLLRIIARLTGADRADTEAIPTDEDALYALSALMAECLEPDAEAGDAVGAWEIAVRHFGGEVAQEKDRLFSHMTAVARALDDGRFTGEIDETEAVLTNAAEGDEGALAEVRFRMARVIALELLREDGGEALKREELVIVTALQAEEIVVPEATEAPEPTREPEITPTPAPTPSVTPEPAREPEITPTPTPKPTVTPEPTQEPINTPTLKPTVTPEPTQEPKITPTPAPKPIITPEPTREPEVTPTPFREPVTTPAPAPEAEQPPAPTNVPTDAPPAMPTEGPAAPPGGTPGIGPSPTPGGGDGGRGEEGEREGGPDHVHAWQDVTETVLVEAQGHWDTLHHGPKTHTETVQHPEEGHYDTVRHEAQTHEETRTVPARTHTEAVAHPEEGHYETVTVVDQAAWEETVRVVDKEGHWVSGTRVRCDCGAELSSMEAYDAHYRSKMSNPDGLDHDSYTTMPYTELVGEVCHYETVHHEAVTHTEQVWKVDRAAWTETVTVVDEEEKTETVTVVDKEAWDEQVWITDKAAWTETVTVVDVAAWDERVWIEDVPEHTETRVTGQICTICGATR